MSFLSDVKKVRTSVEDHCVAEEISLTDLEGSFGFIHFFV